MEILAIFLLLLIIIIVFNHNAGIQKNFKSLENDINELKKLISEPKDQKPADKDLVIKDINTGKPLPTYKSLFVVNDIPVQERASLPEEVALPAEALSQNQETISSAAETDPLFHNNLPPNENVHAKVRKPGFLERNPDMEKFIGENLVSKIGIAVLVLAIGFFVKYAIDQDWISPIGRVSIGIICGAILSAIAHSLRNSYKAFSSVLAGGALAVLYFTITLAFQQFHLFGQAAAFIIMVIITLFAVMLSLFYDRQELAIISLIGGFAAPFLVSNGSGNYKVLFTYLIILNFGLLIIAYKKGWRLLNFLSFVFTAILFVSWMLTLPDTTVPKTYKGGFIFAGIFYLLFFTLNIAHNVKEKKNFIASDFGILLSDTALFFAAGIYFLNHIPTPQYRGLFCAALGIFNLVASYVLFRKQKIDTNILYLLIGITLTFISLTAPIQLHGHYITLFWASEAAVLFWLFLKSGILIIRRSAMIVWRLMAISLVIDWVMIYYLDNRYPLPVIINKAFITTLYSSLATYIFYRLMKQEKVSQQKPKGFYSPRRSFFRIAGIFFLFAAGALEINHQFNFYYPSTGLNKLYLLLYVTAFISCLTAITQKFAPLNISWRTVFRLLALAIVLYLIGLPFVARIQDQMLGTGHNTAHFISHWLTAALIATMLIRIINIAMRRLTGDKGIPAYATWLFCTVIVVFFSQELLFVSKAFYYSKVLTPESIVRVYIKTVLPVLWGVCSFAFMWVGMHYKQKDLRIISLSPFTLTLLKLFIFDIRNIPAAGKIAAFFSLGILLLIVSFMYQRLKKLIVSNEDKVD